MNVFFFIANFFLNTAETLNDGKRFVSAIICCAFHYVAFGTFDALSTSDS